MIRRTVTPAIGASLALFASSCISHPYIQDYHRPRVEERRMATVSYYGSEFAGRKTASGEIYRPHLATAAHRTLPFGTRVRFVEPTTQKSVVVHINDRGPFVGGREFDLSVSAFRNLGSLHPGTRNVWYEILYE